MNFIKCSGFIVLLFSGMKVDAAVIRVAAIGDSITQGLGAPSSFSYPMQLQALLGAGYEVRNFGVIGANVKPAGSAGSSREYAETSAYTESLAFNPHIVISNFGFNQVHDWSGVSDFVADYRLLLDSYQSLGVNPRIIIWDKMIPHFESAAQFDPSITQGINDGLAQIIIDEAGAVEGLDMFSAFSDPSVTRSSHYADSIHPNAQGAQLISEVTAAALLPEPELSIMLVLSGFVFVFRRTKNSR